MFCLDIHTEEVTKLPPKLTASEHGFNDFFIDGKAVSFEDKLEKIETLAAPVLKRMIEGRTLAGLTPKDRRRVAEFMAAQSFQTKAFHEGLADNLDRQAIGRIFSQLWESMFIPAGYIARRHWALMVIDTDEVFYLGDNPVVLQRTETQKTGVTSALTSRASKHLRSPLNAPCTCRAGHKRGQNRALSSRHRSALCGSLARAAWSTRWGRGIANGSIGDQSASSAGSSFHHGDTYNRRCGEYKELELSAMQLGASGHLWRASRLRIARHVFEKNPQYRTVPKTSLVQMNLLVPEPRAKTSDKLTA